MARRTTGICALGFRSNHADNQRDFDRRLARADWAVRGLADVASSLAQDALVDRFAKPFSSCSGLADDLEPMAGL